MRRLLAAALLLAACSSSKEDAPSPAPSPPPAPAPAPAPTATADAAPPKPAAPVVILTIEEGEGKAVGTLAATGRYLYWTETTVDGTRSSLLARSTDAGPREDLGKSLDDDTIAVDEKYVYYREWGKQMGQTALVRRRHEGGELEIVADLPLEHVVLAGDGRLFGVEHVSVKQKDGYQRTSRLWRVTPGSAPQQLFEAESINAVAFHAGRVHLLGKLGAPNAVSMDADGKDQRPLEVGGEIGMLEHDPSGPLVQLVDQRIMQVPAAGPPRVLYKGGFMLGHSERELFVGVGDQTKSSLLAVDRGTGATRELSSPTMFQAVAAGGWTYMANDRRILAVPAP